jgi:hypothetical protein
MRQVLRSVPRIPASCLDEITDRETAESMARREMVARRIAVPIAQATLSAERTGFEGERDFCGACFGIMGALSFGVAVWALAAWIIF